MVALHAADALRVCDDLRTRLREDIGVAPSPRTQELRTQLLR